MNVQSLTMVGAACFIPPACGDFCGANFLKAPPFGYAASPAMP
jgi:hypothetical protein